MCPRIRSVRGPSHRRGAISAWRSTASVRPTGSRRRAGQYRRSGADSVARSPAPSCRLCWMSGRLAASIALACEGILGQSRRAEHRQREERSHHEFTHVDPPLTSLGRGLAGQSRLPAPLEQRLSSFSLFPPGVLRMLCRPTTCCGISPSSPVTAVSPGTEVTPLVKGPERHPQMMPRPIWCQ